MMRARKVVGLFTVLLASILLVACGQKTTKDGVPTILQDKYSGYSKVYGADSLLFTEGGSSLIFDKENKTVTNQNGEKRYFTVISESSLSEESKGVLTKHKSELEDKEYFLINISSGSEESRKKTSSKTSNQKIKPYGLYCVVLTDGGKTIRIFEFESGTADAYYDFTGQATK